MLVNLDHAVRIFDMFDRAVQVQFPLFSCV